MWEQLKMVDMGPHIPLCQLLRNMAFTLKINLPDKRAWLELGWCLLFLRKVCQSSVVDVIYLEYHNHQVLLSWAAFKVWNRVRGLAERWGLCLLFDGCGSVRSVGSLLLHHKNFAGEAVISIHIYREGSERGGQWEVMSPPLGLWVGKRGGSKDSISRLLTFKLSCLW